LPSGGQSKSKMWPEVKSVTGRGEYHIARELDPALVHQWYGFSLLALNRVPEADGEFKKFNDFLPFLVSASASYGQYFYFRGQNDLAVDQLNKTVAMQPDYAPAHEFLGMVYEREGRTNEAITEMQKAIDLSGGEYGLGSLGHVHASVGRRNEARNVLRSIAQQASRTHVSPYQSAVVHAGLGDKDKAIDPLEQAFAERSLSAPVLRCDPRSNNLRAEPRFQEFVRRVGLSF
jgi:tetratricopeptide (TPR) repeat protein